MSGNYYRNRANLLEAGKLSIKELQAEVSTLLADKIHGLSFSPYISGQGPGTQITEAQIHQRLQLMAPYVKWVRTFSCTEGNELIPKIAAEYGLKTLVGHAPSDNKFQVAGGNSFVPAFAIPVAKYKGSPIMSFEKSTFQHEFACRPAGLKSDKKFTTEITLYSLVLSVDSQKKEDIIVTRRANDVIMKAKNITKPKKPAKMQGGIPHEWRAYEHLLK